MKTTNNNKTITNSAYVLFFALLLASQSGYTQGYGGRTGTSQDTYVINDDDSNKQAVLRLQNDNRASLIASNNNGLKFNFADNRSHSDYGTTRATLSREGWFTANRYIVGSGSNNGYYFWGRDDFNISMGNSTEFNYGPVTGHSIKTSMSNNSYRGFTWGAYQQTPTAALSTKGEMQLATSLAIGGNLIPNTVLTVDGRTYISENGGRERGLSNVNNDNYKDYLLWVEEGIVSADFALAETTDWPDYVFKESYKLSSIEEIEQHILEEGHLPNFPSAEEVETMGYSLDDMTKRLLKTVEEMTLHTIQQEKKIATQNSMMQQLVNRLEALENKKY
jgi:hypothetical protein